MLRNSKRKKTRTRLYIRFSFSLFSFQAGRVGQEGARETEKERRGEIKEEKDATPGPQAFL